MKENKVFRILKLKHSDLETLYYLQYYFGTWVPSQYFHDDKYFLLNYAVAECQSRYNKKTPEESEKLKEVCRYFLGQLNWSDYLNKTKKYQLRENEATISYEVLEESILRIDNNFYLLKPGRKRYNEVAEYSYDLNYKNSFEILLAGGASDNSDYVCYYDFYKFDSLDKARKFLSFINTAVSFVNNAKLDAHSPFPYFIDFYSVTDYLDNPSNPIPKIEFEIVGTFMVKNDKGYSELFNVNYIPKLISRYDHFLTHLRST
jgi:hypothetical protein